MIALKYAELLVLVDLLYLASDTQGYRPLQVFTKGIAHIFLSIYQI